MNKKPAIDHALHDDYRCAYLLSRIKHHLRNEELELLVNAPCTEIPETGQKMIALSPGEATRMAALVSAQVNYIDAELQHARNRIIHFDIELHGYNPPNEPNAQPTKP